MDEHLKKLRENASRPRRTVGVLLNGEIREQIEAIEAEIDQLEEQVKDQPADSGPYRVSPVKARLAERMAQATQLREQATDSTLYLVLEGMQRTPYRALIASHPPRTDADGRIVPDDRWGANSETIAPELVRGCIVGYRERPENTAEVKRVDDDTVNWLLGWTEVTGAGDDGQPLTVEHSPFLTDRQMEMLSNTALVLCRGDDAVPLPRQRSQTPTPDAG